MTPRRDDEPPGPRKALVESQIVEAATKLFAERGYAGTSLQDIAQATGLTRPALYHYFASKEDLLSRLVSSVTEDAAGEMGRIRRRPDASCVERLHAMAAAVVLRQARNPARFQLLLRSEAELPASLAKTYDAGRRRVLREFTTVIDEGVHDGAFRVVDPRTAALGIIGLCNWVAWWHKPGGGDQRLADELAEQAVASVVASDGRATSGQGVDRALELLKQDVTTLDRLLRERRPATG